MTVAQLLVLILALPTALPATSGRLWLNGRIVCVS